MRGPALAIVLALALPPLAAAGETPPAVLEIHNDTGGPIDSLEVAPPGVDRGNLLEEGAPMPPGAWAELALDPADGCLYAVWINFEGIDLRVREDVDVCASDRLHLSTARPLAGYPHLGRRFAPPGRGIPFCPGDPRCKRK